MYAGHRWDVVWSHIVVGSCGPGGPCTSPSNATSLFTHVPSVVSILQMWSQCVELSLALDCCERHMFPSHDRAVCQHQQPLLQTCCLQGQIPIAFRMSFQCARIHGEWCEALSRIWSQWHSTFVTDSTKWYCMSHRGWCLWCNPIWHMSWGSNGMPLCTLWSWSRLLPCELLTIAQPRQYISSQHAYLSEWASLFSGSPITTASTTPSATSTSTSSAPTAMCWGWRDAVHLC